MKTIRCRDAGIDCDAVIRGNTDEEVLRKATEHSQRAHGMKQMSPELERRVRSLIKEEPGRA